MVYDDGSTIEADGSGATGSPVGYLLGDLYDTAHMEPAKPVQDSSEPWYVQLVQYGATRWIDNRLGPVNTAGNTNPGTFAGANGRTYTNPGSATGQPVAGAPRAGSMQVSGDGVGMMILAALAALALG